MTTCLLVVVALVSVCLNNRVSARDGCVIDDNIRCGPDLCGVICKCGDGEYDSEDASSWCCTTTSNTTCSTSYDSPLDGMIAL